MSGIVGAAAAGCKWAVHTGLGNEGVQYLLILLASGLKQVFMSEQNNHPDDEILCFCSGVKRSKIRDLYQQGFDIRGIADMTGAMTGCGGCEWDIEYYLKELETGQGK
ncbi:BFD-like [2Fe-2S] binding domain-containing protein [Methylobacillus rhizosphaerae]|uniref:BFD-like [2Fe-2S] binding domain-containing protein n=2 Tax=Methylobacillus rhizosphaerae TaxID=551994 RepID=A0A239A468_9PROT|nr:BFD-like [2Fe-2S] binding domain-containing protein [Methylobacillus rhizosphaerae]